MKAVLNATGAAEGTYTAYLSEYDETCENATSKVEIGSGEATGEGTINILNDDLENPGSLADRVALLMSGGESSQVVACGPINPAGNR